MNHPARSRPRSSNLWSTHALALAGCAALAGCTSVEKAKLDLLFWLGVGVALVVLQALTLALGWLVGRTRAVRIGAITFSWCWVAFNAIVFAYALHTVTSFASSERPRLVAEFTFHAGVAFTSFALALALASWAPAWPEHPDAPRPLVLPWLAAVGVAVLALGACAVVAVVVFAMP